MALKKTDAPGTTNDGVFYYAALANGQVVDNLTEERIAQALHANKEVICSFNRVEHGDKIIDLKQVMDRARKAMK